MGVALRRLICIFLECRHTAGKKRHPQKICTKWKFHTVRNRNFGRQKKRCTIIWGAVGGKKLFSQRQWWFFELWKNTVLPCWLEHRKRCVIEQLVSGGGVGWTGKGREGQRKVGKGKEGQVESKGRKRKKREGKVGKAREGEVKGRWSQGKEGKKAWGRYESERRRHRSNKKNEMECNRRGTWLDWKYQGKI